MREHWSIGRIMSKKLEVHHRAATIRSLPDSLKGLLYILSEMTPPIPEPITRTDDVMFISPSDGNLPITLRNKGLHVLTPASTKEGTNVWDVIRADEHRDQDGPVFHLNDTASIREYMSCIFSLRPGAVIYWVPEPVTAQRTLGRSVEHPYGCGLASLSMNSFVVMATGLMLLAYLRGVIPIIEIERSNALLHTSPCVDILTVMTGTTPAVTFQKSAFGYSKGGVTQLYTLLDVQALKTTAAAAKGNRNITYGECCSAFADHPPQYCDIVAKIIGDNLPARTSVTSMLVGCELMVARPLSFYEVIKAAIDNVSQEDREYGDMVRLMLDSGTGRNWMAALAQHIVEFNIIVDARHVRPVADYIVRLEAEQHVDSEMASFQEAVAMSDDDMQMTVITDRF